MQHHDGFRPQLDKTRRQVESNSLIKTWFGTRIAKHSIASETAFGLAHELLSMNRKRHEKRFIRHQEHHLLASRFKIGIVTFAKSKQHCCNSGQGTTRT